MPRHRRSAAITRATLLGSVVAVLVAVGLRVVAATEANREVLYLVFGLPLIAMLVWLAVTIIRTPKPSVSKRPKTSSRVERKVLRRLTPRKWETANVQAGTAVEDKTDPEQIIVQTPTVTDIKPCALGFSLTVEAVPGQTPKHLADRLPNLASALAVPLRLNTLGTRTVEVITEVRDPLSGVREVGHAEDTRIRLGRCDDGSEAVIDILDATHGIVQGMTRAGKTALFYNAFGQLIEVPIVQIRGIDPNAVLLWPLAELLGRDHIVTGNDPEGALRLLTEIVAEMDRRRGIVKTCGSACHAA